MFSFLTLFYFVILSLTQSLTFDWIKTGRRRHTFYQIKLIYRTSVKKGFLTNFLITSVCPARAAACNAVALSLSSRFTGSPPSFRRAWIIQIKVGFPTSFPGLFPWLSKATRLHILEVLLIYCGTMCLVPSQFYYSYWICFQLGDHPRRPFGGGGGGEGLFGWEKTPRVYKHNR